MGLPAVVQLRPPLHRGQLRLLRALEQYRFVSAPCGRRFGKTLFLLLFLLMSSIARPRAMSWWVDPIHYLAKRAYRQMEQVVINTGLAKQGGVLKSELRIELVNDSVIEFHSAERGDRLRGEGLNLACLNEASLIKAQLWFEALYPMLTDTGGQAAFAFTPKGQGHWTHQVFQWGRSGEKPDYHSIQLPTSANPFIKPRMIAEAKKDLPADTFRQEYLAEFLPDSSGVFRNVAACTGGALDDPRIIPVDGPYAGGVDLAKHNDFTVVSILDRNGRLCWHDRFHRMDWPLMEERISEAAKRYRAHLLVESNSVGDAVIDHLREAGVSCDGFSTTGSSKQALIQGLMVALEQRLIRFPDLPELLVELQIFEYERTPSGHIQYSAPEGAHDDEVMALALAVKAWRDARKNYREGYLSTDLDALRAERRHAA